MADRAKKREWGFVSGRVAALEARMLPLEFFEQIIAGSRPQDIVRGLDETALGEQVRQVEDLERADCYADEVYRRALKAIEELCPSPTVVDLLGMRQDFRSLKNFVKRRYMNLDLAPTAPWRYGDEVWQRLWDGLDVPVGRAFLCGMGEARRAVSSAPQRPELLDAAVDSVSLSALCEKAGETGSPLIGEYFGRYDTAKGVEMLWRARAVGAEQDVLESICEGRPRRELFFSLLRSEDDEWPDLLASAMEGLQVQALFGLDGLRRIGALATASDSWLMECAREAKYVVFGPERVFGYLVGLEAELHNLGLCASGRAMGILPELLRRRLRACYV